MDSVNDTKMEEEEEEQKVVVNCSSFDSRRWQKLQYQHHLLQQQQQQQSPRCSTMNMNTTTIPANFKSLTDLANDLRERRYRTSTTATIAANPTKSIITCSSNNNNSSTSLPMHNPDTIHALQALGRKHFPPPQNEYNDEDDEYHSVASTISIDSYYTTTIMDDDDYLEISTTSSGTSMMVTRNIRLYYIREIEAILMLIFGIYFMVAMHFTHLYLLSSINDTYTVSWVPQLSFFPNNVFLSTTTNNVTKANYYHHYFFYYYRYSNMKYQYYPPFECQTKILLQQESPEIEESIPIIVVPSKPSENLQVEHHTTPIVTYETHSEEKGQFILDSNMNHITNEHIDKEENETENQTMDNPSKETILIHSKKITKQSSSLSLKKSPKQQQQQLVSKIDYNPWNYPIQNLKNPLCMKSNHPSELGFIPKQHRFVYQEKSKLSSPPQKQTPRVPNRKIKISISNDTDETSFPQQQRQQRSPFNNNTQTTALPITHHDYPSSSKNDSPTGIEPTKYFNQTKFVTTMAPPPILTQFHNHNEEKLKFWWKVIEKNEHFSSNIEKKKAESILKERNTFQTFNTTATTSTTSNSRTETDIWYHQTHSHNEHFIWNNNEYDYHDWTKIPPEGLKSSLRHSIVEHSDDRMQQDLKCWKNDTAMLNNTNEIMIPNENNYKLLSEKTSTFTSQITQNKSSVEERKGDGNTQLSSNDAKPPLRKGTKNSTKLQQIRNRVTNFWHTGPTFVHLSSSKSQSNRLHGKQKRFSWKKIVSNFLRLHHPFSSNDLLSSQQHNIDGENDDEENEKKQFFTLLQSILEQQRSQRLSAIPEWMDEKSEEDFLDIPIMETIGHFWKNRKQHDRQNNQKKPNQKIGQGTKKKKKKQYKKKQDKK